ncbi:methylated-DNA--[protein]-cysteine S-methyltransferase [bacterium]|nr:methylated-DNA--[protein]-cysteine S-methyltransferase [bacterium]MBU1753865.1 methylated-DNA--[protein]-cysteine S-methyltransferase [bacterium]
MEIQEKEEIYRYVYFNTTLGWMGIASSDQGIRAIVLPQKERKMVTRELRKQLPPNANMLFDFYYFSEISEAFKHYFRKRSVIFDFPLDINRGNVFERKVWDATCSVPHGEIRTYKWVAQEIGYPEAARPVASALRYNPLPIIIPCHRVVTSEYSREGYSRGFEWKRKLLEIERRGRVLSDFCTIKET